MIDDPQLDAASVAGGRFCPQDPATVGRALIEPTRVEQWLLPPTGLGRWFAS